MNDQACTAGHCFDKLMVVQLATALTSWWLYSWSLFWRPFV